MSTNIGLQPTAPSASKGPTGIESLAPEILLMVVTRLEDLVSLDCLIRASPDTFRLFDSRNAVKIFDSVLSAGAIHSTTQTIIRIIAFIRSSALPMSNLECFRRQVTVEAMFYHSRISTEDVSTPSDYDPLDSEEAALLEFGRQRIRIQSAIRQQIEMEDYFKGREIVPEATFGTRFRPESLPEKTTPAILRSILATNRRNTCLTLDCLESYLAEFRSAKPKHLVDKDYCWRDFQPWKNDIQYRTFQTRDVGPPSWTEEQRAYRAFWRLQILWDLRKAASHELLDWPMEDVQRFECGEAATNGLVLCLAEDLGRADYQRQMDLLYVEDLYTPIDLNKPHPEFEEIRSVIDYVTSVRGATYMKQLDHGGPAQEVRRASRYPAPGANDWTMMNHPSRGYEFYFTLSGGTHQASGGFRPLKYISFDLFRSLGLAFWYVDRLSAYGLVPVPPVRERWDENFFSFAWRSLLGGDQITEQEREFDKEQLWNQPFHPGDTLSDDAIF